ncbi:hypothetical protein BDV40DRAFT_168882 [Aspergillus tamarii]|uniref:Uncharacterized protein n=1 Tax=Aspergillus tamarii TaxID=41984 RepID=A0A5N6V9T3_ASPTM|nr:hypothetical protein BDV40DRAFT_168882 [Aspergillus tamarii]
MSPKCCPASPRYVGHRWGRWRSSELLRRDVIARQAHNSPRMEKPPLASACALTVSCSSDWLVVYSSWRTWTKISARGFF